MTRRGAGLPELAVLASALPLLLVDLGGTPGLHGDEGWVIGSAHRLAESRFRFDGMNSYTGALHLYVLWPAFELFGYRVEVLRGASVLLNLGALLLLMRGARELGLDRRTALCAGLLVASSPAFVTLSRFGTEVTTLVPLLAVGGLVGILRSTREPGARATAAAVLGGALLGLASFTHIVALGVPLAAASTAALVEGPRVLLGRSARFAALGFGLGFLPRIVRLAGGSDGVWSARLEGVASGGFLPDLLAAPAVLARVADGHLLYLRFTGETLVPVVPYLAVGGIALLGLRLRDLRSRPLQRGERWLLVFLPLSTAFVAIVTPGLSARFLELAALLLPLLLASLAAGVAAQAGAARIAALAIVVSLLGLNVFYVVADYYVAFSRSGGTPGVFRVGSRLVESSSHFVRVDGLYRQLVERGIERVYTKNLIRMSLWGYDVEADRFDTKRAPPLHPPRIEEAEAGRRLAVVYYNAPMVMQRKTIWDPSGWERLDAGAVCLRRDRSFDPHFAVFVPDREAPDCENADVRFE